MTAGTDKGRAEYARRHGKPDTTTAAADASTNEGAMVDDRREGHDTSLAAGSAAYQARKNGRTN